MSIQKLAAIVPMRHESERVKGKNYRPLGGMPLFHHIVKTLLGCASIDRVVIDTDSPTITKSCKKDFPQIKVIQRPAHLRDGATPMNDVLKHTVSKVEADIFLQTHSTNPLLTIETIETAIATFKAAALRNDSLFGVTRVQQRLWDAMATPVNHDPAVLMRTQDLRPLFIENSTLYLFKRELIETTGNRIGQRPLLYEIDRIEAHDIDEEADFTLAELMYQHRQIRQEKAA